MLLDGQADTATVDKIALSSLDVLNLPDHKGNSPLILAAHHQSLIMIKYVKMVFLCLDQDSWMVFIFYLKILKCTYVGFC